MRGKTQVVMQIKKICIYHYIDSRNLTELQNKTPKRGVRVVKTIELDSFYFFSQQNIFEVCCLDTHIAEKEVQKFYLKSTVNGLGRDRKEKKKKQRKP